jgi:predicted TPR repeat methyltransferase
MNSLNDPYIKSAKLYDRILSHVDYEDWAAYIIEISEHHEVELGSLLDIACGTGSFLLELEKYQLDLAGIEISSEMLKIAEAKIDAKTKLTLGNMLDFKLSKKFDAITCLFDSVNYLAELKQVGEFINYASKNLNENGLLIFDAVSQKACKYYFGNYTESDVIDEIEYTRYCHYDFAENIQVTEFTFKENNQLFYEEHHQYIYTFAEIIEEVKKTKLKLLAVYSDFELNEIHRNTDRAHFVLQKV